MTRHWILHTIMDDHRFSFCLFFDTLFGHSQLQKSFETIIIVTDLIEIYLKLVKMWTRHFRIELFVVSIYIFTSLQTPLQISVSQCQLTYLERKNLFRNVYTILIYTTIYSEGYSKESILVYVTLWHTSQIK